MKLYPWQQPNGGENAVTVFGWTEVVADGTMPPAEVVRLAHESGLSGLSLTDHDTVLGIDEARAEAKRLGVDFTFYNKTIKDAIERKVKIEGLEDYFGQILIPTEKVTEVRNGKRVVSSSAAIGSAATPTPTGSFYVNQRLIPTDPSGPFGPGAVGISAFSNVLTGWTQGGPIAIHGTNAPWSIGKAVSNGCIRLPNPTLRRVFAQALAGTPVIIHA